MGSGDDLTSLRGIRFKEVILTQVSRSPYRHFGIPPEENSEPPLGLLSVFSFLAPAPARTDLSYNSEWNLRSSLIGHFNTGLYLHAKEKGITFPVIHFTDDRDALKKKLCNEDVLENEYLLYQGVYREVRSLIPEGMEQNGPGNNTETTAYIVMGFKSMDKHFCQNVMVDSWKDWTGARYIYMNIPDELGLSRISFYQREAPQSFNIFLYVVLVECSTVHTKEDQTKLLDFTQRLRAERMTGFVSVYGVFSVD